ncbi:hypothetical protein ACFPTY_00875 [Halomonas beimenensis]|uniref:Uncharacterized protein n=2 Tax=Halomonas beimenensis TaxID=475662 RepID=A0A291P3N4_9GAMM|nr:hypothetical protein BEI_0519 [Halomonas beimenensis]
MPSRMTALAAVSIGLLSLWSMPDWARACDLVHEAAMEDRLASRLSSLPAAAAADSAGDLGGMVERLSAWIAEQLAYPVPPPPELRLEGEVALKSRCFPAFPLHLAPRVLGAYDAEEGVIYLNQHLDLTRRVDRSYLLHELVHHFQLHQRPANDDRCKGRLDVISR